MLWERQRTCQILLIIFLSGSVARAGTDFRYQGQNLLAGPPESERWTAQSGELVPEKDGFSLTSLGEKPAVFSTSVELERGRDYFFSARVQSDSRVVILLDEGKMAYHRQGQEQVVCGLVRSGQGGRQNLQIQLSPLTGTDAATARVTHFLLQKVERPATVESRPREGNTLLVKDGQAEAVIIYPAGSPVFETLAGKVKDTVEKIYGVALPVVADTLATEAKYPVLKPEYAGRNLILIGQLGNNRALWPAYNRFLAAEDGYYPGGDGYVVRTAVDVLDNGKNQIILGGSSEKGASRAVDEFCARLAENSVAAKSAGSVPWLLQVELDGKCREAFAADQKLWQNPEDDRLPALTSGYGKVARWYQNAMGYYWSAGQDYLQRSQSYLKLILDERAYTHHYLVEFFIRTYDMLDDSPVLSASEVARVDGLILENFLDFSWNEAPWMTVFSPPYETIKIVNRHQIAPWYSDLTMARFLLRHVDLSGGLRDLVAFRASEKQAAFRAFVSNRNGPSMPGMATAASDWEEIPAAFFRFALENDFYDEFFASGLAHQALGLERIDHLSGRYTSPGAMTDLLPVWLGAMSQLTQDTRYDWLRRNLPFVQDERGPFQGRYVAGVHRYQPAENNAPEQPGSDWSGIRVSPQPQREDQISVLPAPSFPFLSLRGGFGPEDDYLAVIGLNTAKPSGTLLAAKVGGIPFITGSGPADAGRALSNGASAVRLSGYKVGRAPLDEGASPSEVRWTGELSETWAFEVDTELSPEMRWERIVIRLNPGVFVFCDTFVASQPGKYLLRMGWWPEAPLQAVKGGWEATTHLGTVGVSVAGEGFEAAWRSETLSVESVRSMKVNETATVWTVVQKSEGKGTWEMRSQGPNQIRLTRGTGEPRILQRGPLVTAAGSLPAGLIIASASGIDLFGLPAGAKASPVARQVVRAGGEDLTGLGGAAISLTAIDEALAKIPETSFVPDAGSTLAITDDTRLWAEAWSYEGLQKPSILTDWKVQDGIVDFGRVVDLAEIRSMYRGRTYEVTQVPRKIFAAPASSPSAPADGAKEWAEVTGRFALRPQPRTGNYGETLPMKEGDESLFLEGVRTRFLKLPGAASLFYFTNDERSARHPVKLDVLNHVPGVSFPLLKASSNLFPAFPRRDREDDFSLALLNAENGRPVGQIDVIGPVQGALVADQRGRGEAEVFVLKADARIETFSLKGKPGEPIDLFKQFSDFQQTNGRENTRIPAGGHYMPFSFGLWRKEENGARKFVIGRYGSLAFLDANRRLEGILNFPSYAAAVMLDQGQDFDGDGQDEMLVLEMTRLVHVGGEAQPEVRDQVDQFWPQTYHLDAVTYAKDSDTTLLSGAPVHLFEALSKFDGAHRLVLVARENYLGIYDATDRVWVFSWRPPAAIAAAALTQQTAENMEVVLATRDRLLWRLSWKSGRLSRPAVELTPASIEVREIRSGSESGGSALIAAREGLFFLPATAPPHLVQVAKGDFQSALILPSSDIAAADSRGKVLCFRKSSPGTFTASKPEQP